ncbi:MAG: hypothetical protein JJU20_04140 [Opitutales bacterium]|nr:hypothetical protein [Opitutales bacterium]
MSQKSVYAIAESHQQAEEIVSSLKAAEFPNDRISVLFPDKSNTRDFAHEKNTKAPEGAVTGGVTGGLFGGALGWIAGIGALAIPGAGPFIAAGPLAAAIGGVAVGASLGGIAGGLVGMGIPEIEAKRYEGKIKKGNILISVHTKSSDEISRAKEILESNNAEDISTASMDKTDKSDDKKSDRHAETPDASTRSRQNPNNNPEHGHTAVLPAGDSAPRKGAPSGIAQR